MMCVAISSLSEVLDDLRQRYGTVLNTIQQVLTEQQVVDALGIDSVTVMELVAELMRQPAVQRPDRVDFGAGRRLIEVVNRVMTDDSGWTVP